MPLRIIPKFAQYKNWSIPSKATFISLIIGAISLIFTVGVFVNEKLSNEQGPINTTIYSPHKIPLKASDLSFKLYISNRKIDDNFLRKAPQFWHGKANINRFNCFSFDMQLVPSVYNPSSSRGRANPQAVYKANNITLPVETTYAGKLHNLDGLTLKVTLPYNIQAYFGDNSQCSLEVQGPDNWGISGLDNCVEGAEITFEKKS